MHPLAALALCWLGIRKVMGWDNGTSFGYLFQSGSGATLELAAWGTAVYLWRSSCSDRRWCLRHGSHPVTDPQTGTTHRVCWKHAHLPSKYGIGRIRAIQARHSLLYLGSQPGRDRPRQQPPAELPSPREALYVQPAPEVTPMRATALSAPRLLILVLLAVLAAACAVLVSRGLAVHAPYHLAMHYHGRHH